MANSSTELDRLKLKYVPWYCDKEPLGFVQFVDNCTAVTRSLSNVLEVEAYLDAKLSRTTYQAMSVSSIISDDPNFAPAPTMGKGT